MENFYSYYSTNILDLKIFISRSLTTNKNKPFLNGFCFLQSSYF